MIRILVTASFSSEALDLLNEIPEFEIHSRPGLASEELLAEIRNADVLVCPDSPALTEPILEAGAELKLVILSGDQGGFATEAAPGRHLEIRRIEANEAAGDAAIAILKDFFNV